MSESSLNLQDAISRANPIWLHDSVQDRSIAVKWMENGSRGNTYPQLVIRIGQHLGLSNKDAACLVRLLDNHRSLDMLMMSGDFLDSLPFSSIWIWEKADALYQRRQNLKNWVSVRDTEIIFGYWRSDEPVGGLLLKFEIFEALAGYYMVTGGATAHELRARTTEVSLATGWSKEQTMTVVQAAHDQALQIAILSANEVFRHMLENQGI